MERIFEGLARQKQLQLQLDLDAGVNCDVLIDPLRFKQIVSNLLSNAIKFTAEGYVRLNVRTQAGKEQLAVMLQVAALAAAPTRDITWIFYDHEEVEAAARGARRALRTGIATAEGLAAPPGALLAAV